MHPHLGADAHATTTTNNNSNNNSHHTNDFDRQNHRAPAATSNPFDDDASPSSSNPFNDNDRDRQRSVSEVPTFTADDAEMLNSGGYDPYSTLGGTTNDDVGAVRRAPIQHQPSGNPRHFPAPYSADTDYVDTKQPQSYTEPVMSSNPFDDDSKSSSSTMNNTGTRGNIRRLGGQSQSAGLPNSDTDAFSEAQPSRLSKSLSPGPISRRRSRKNKKKRRSVRHIAKIAD